MRLYVRDEVKETNALLKDLLKVILRIMKENIETYMPGFTHLQKAQPVTVAHHSEHILKCSEETAQDLMIFMTE